MKLTDGKRVFDCEVREITPHPLEPLVYDRNRTVRPPLAALLYCEDLASVKENVGLKWIYEHPDKITKNHAEARMVVIRRGGFIAISQKVSGLEDSVLQQAFIMT